MGRVGSRPDDRHKRTKRVDTQTMDTLLEDYVNLISKPQFYITHKYWSYPMRTLKWDSLFNLEEETSIVDMASQNKTRPSCARVKVEVDLMRDFLNGLT
ncbi:hypothetical protein H5410_047566 [Solanum commersonii]|uniref:Uncharacterized protein n=1 Tax=Solanum commersonii TaxID=4109 RepID=A0A9J5XIN0_SOLCO|nr:hypothetical protein H5410_047566 [Solanum commersonii]